MIICISSEKKNSVRQPSISPENRGTVRSFVRSPDISYFKTGWRDTICCRKNQQGEKCYMLYDSIYRPRNYLLWALKKFYNFSILNLTMKFQITQLCCKQWRIHIGNQKHIRWWLQLMAIKASLCKANRHSLALKITDDILCLEKEFDYCNDFAKVVLASLWLRKYSSDNIS